MSRRVEIVGGGLAGLSLALALQRSGADVSVFEAGTYPRHRVCGEFIAGLGASTISALGLESLLAEAKPLREVAWFSRGRLLRRQTLPQPALALSRWALDHGLAQAFEQAGGDLQIGRRIEDNTTPEGRVFATGRQRAVSPWLGLKVHARGLSLESELEFHLGKGAYAGLSAVENGFVNICGLFRRQSGLSLDRRSALLAYLRCAELGGIADRLEGAEIDIDSFSSVAGFAFVTQNASPTRISLGDRFAMIPPYTGNGMALAFQTAECALAPLLAWTRQESDWAQAVRVTMKAIRHRVHRRLFIASQLHRFLHSPMAQSVFNAANRSRFLPLGRLIAAVHA